ncbi:MAG TPA: hypothetical protein VF132_08615, partial [Rudaea sp.]
ARTRERRRSAEPYGLNAPAGASVPMRARFAWPFFGTFLIVFAVRLAFVLAIAPEIPFYDEWDGVIDAIARPLRAGSFSPAFFIAAHNEHALFWTKQLSYLVLRAGDLQFDNVPVCEISQLLFALVVAAAAAGAARQLGRFAAPFAACVVLMAIVPYGWETIGMGWGNPYYFLVGLSLLAIALAATIRGVAGSLALGAAIIAAALAMGSGWFVGAIAFGALALRVRIGDLTRAGAWRLAALPILAMSIAMAMTIHPHRTIATWSAVATLELAIVLALMFPTWLLLARIVHRQGDRIDIAFVAAALWGLAQFGAILLARPEFRLWYPVSRYVDVLGCLAFANLGCLCRLALAMPRSKTWTRLPWLALAAAFAMGVGFAPLAWRYTQWRADNERAQTQRVSRYVRDGDIAAITQAPQDELPYPSRERLRVLIDAADVREILGDRVGTRAAPAPFVADARRFDAALVRNQWWWLPLFVLCGVLAWILPGRVSRTRRIR